MIKGRETLVFLASVNPACARLPVSWICQSQELSNPEEKKELDKEGENGTRIFAPLMRKSTNNSFLP